MTREQGRLAVRRALVSVAGTIQPAVLAKALDEDALQAGLGARFLMAMPTRSKRVWNENQVSDSVVDRYKGLLTALLKLQLDDPVKRKPHIQGLSNQAYRLWVDFYNEWGTVQESAEGEQAAAFAKIEAYAARLLLLHHVVTHIAAGQNDRCPVSEASAAAGIELARWFAFEAQRIYSILSESAEERDTRRLVEWIQRRRGQVTARQLQRSNSRKYPNSEASTAALDALAGAGVGESIDPMITDRGGQPVRRFRLHPTPDTTDPSDDDLDNFSSDITCDSTPENCGFPAENGGSVGSVGRRTAHFGNGVTISGNGSSVGRDEVVSDDFESQWAGEERATRGREPGEEG